MKTFKQLSLLGGVFISLFLFSCKRDKISTHTIKGQVFNQCTDSGMAGITVDLRENGGTLTHCVSDASGNFSFSNVHIHSSSKYGYSIYISSESGIGGGVGFDGQDIQLDKGNLDMNFTLPVVPHSKAILLYFPNGTSLSINDTFLLTLKQDIYHKHFPNGNYLITAGDSPTYPPPTTNFIGNIGNYWMGWWHVKLDKTKNGVHIIKTDSFYVGYGATITDTIPW